ncbi:MAG: carboxylating nicotinate-nucleotide diphosphorylase [Proteobacteria bacterium]|nr:carboxylating nicotinate-nucleotide diphosphorylase [Pseudomonadota bacterium]
MTMKKNLEKWSLNDFDLRLIDLALAEDLGDAFQDITTETLFLETTQIFNARIISKNPEPIIICGLPVVSEILSKFSSSCFMKTHFKDGEVLSSGETLLTLTGTARELLMAERTILNFLQRLCAVATLTSKFVKAVEGTALKILDTRKTTPGFRHLEKYAVYCGGGVNHRVGLYDALLIKDTHIDLLGGVSNTLEKLPHTMEHLFPVIIEIRTLNELSIVLNNGRDKITRILLDNMSLSEMSEAALLCRGIFPTEASGNISLNNILDIAKTNVDYASIGKLTHSAGSVDLSMKCDF